MHSSQRQTVLIVDDDAAICRTLDLLLSDEGYAVLEARDGLEAMDALQASGERLIVLLDLMMPRMSGPEVLNCVDQLPDLANRHTFIVMTANKAAISPDCAAVLQRHGIPVIAKPFDFEVLLTTMQAASRCLLACTCPVDVPHQSWR